mgnify:CR=1 FL=1
MGTTGTIMGVSKFLKEKNIDIEIQNWKNLKFNSEKMAKELLSRVDKIKAEIETENFEYIKISAFFKDIIEQYIYNKKNISSLLKELQKLYSDRGVNLKKTNEIIFANQAGVNNLKIIYS